LARGRGPRWRQLARLRRPRRRPRDRGEPIWGRRCRPSPLIVSFPGSTPAPALLRRRSYRDDAPWIVRPPVVQESPVDRSRLNVLLLALCQAAFISTAALMSTIGTLAGHALAADKALATLPATALTVGTALGTIPASLVMRRVGRRLGFIVG